MANGDTSDTTNTDTSHASDKTNQPDRLEITLGDDTAGVDAPQAMAEGGTPVGLAAGGTPPDTIVNTLKTTWDVMKDNRSVTNNTSDVANAVPQGVGFTDLAGWASEPRQLTLHYVKTNFVGMNTVDLVVSVLWYYNGSAKGGGQFINNATVYCNGFVAPGRTVNIAASVGNPMNDGTLTQPIAVLPITIRIEYSDLVQNESTVYLARICGNGAGTLRKSP